MTPQKSHTFKNTLAARIILVGILAFALSVPPLFAAENDRVYFETNKAAAGSDISVGVYIDTPISTNALDMQITYPTDMLAFSRFDTAGSIVSFWQGKPELLSAGHIKLTGGMLAPFSGVHGLVVTILFTSKATGPASLSFERNNLYRADGNGTKVPAVPEAAVLAVSHDASMPATNIPAPVLSSNDTTVPTVFLQTFHDEATGRDLIVFTATDAESGIIKTEMRFRKWNAWSDWQEVQNPTLYPSGAWDIELRVTNAANLTATASLHLTIKLFEKILLYVVILVVLVIFARKMYNVMRKKK